MSPGGSPARREHDAPGTPYDRDLPGLERSARAHMRGPPVWLSAAQAATATAQFRATAAHRGWALLASAVMAGHAHLVVGVGGDPDPADLLRDFKAYAARSLNRGFGRPPSGTWWAASGSRRKLPTERAVRAAVRYVRAQPRCLCGWADPAVVGRPGGVFVSSEPPSRGVSPNTSA